jgi:hypothetical protein
MDRNLCCFVELKDDDIDLDWFWVSLEDALDQYIFKIEMEKFDLLPVASEPHNSEPFWTMVPYYEAEIQMTLEIWDDYIKNIIERLPAD